MPSPTSITRPTSRTSMRDSNCSTSCWITEAISSALNLMNTPIDHLLANGLQLVGDGAVVDGIADAKDGPADQCRIDGGIQNRPPAKRRAQQGGNALELLRIDRGGRGNMNAGLFEHLLVQFSGLAPNRP